MSDLDEQGLSMRLWVCAAVGALALHLGGVALAVAHLRTEALTKGELHPLDTVGTTFDR